MQRRIFDCCLRLTQPLHALHRHTGGQRSPNKAVSDHHTGGQRSLYRRSAIAIHAVSNRHTSGQRSPHRSILLDCLVCVIVLILLGHTTTPYYYMMQVELLHGSFGQYVRRTGGENRPMLLRQLRESRCGQSPQYRSARRDTTSDRFVPCQR